MLVVYFSAWGEGFFLASQTAVIGALVLFFGRSLKEALLFTISYLAVCVILMGGYTSVSVLWSLQAVNVPVIVVSKVSVLEQGSREERISNTKCFNKIRLDFHI